jgi:zinc/manganese transport system substrate-binding protein
VTNPFILASLALALALPQESAPPVRVVTTLDFLARLTRDVGGDAVDVTALVDGRQDPHFVEPRPTLMQRAREADLFVEVGLDLELWADKVVEGSGNARIQRGRPGRVVASLGLPTLELPAELSREWGDVHPSGNPHVWLDPLLAIDMAANIAEGLAAVDPARAERYRQGLEALRADLGQRLFGARLVAEVGAAKLARMARQGRLEAYLEERELAHLRGGWLADAAPLSGRPIVSYHRTFTYFAARFGLRVPIQIEDKPGIPPSGRQRDRVLEVLRAEGVRTLLLERFYERGAADWLAEKSGASVQPVAIDTGEALGLESYAALIDALLAAVAAGETAGAARSR